MNSEQRVPQGVDPNTPSIARVYDYFLGGKDNFAVDRHVAELTYKIIPDAQIVGQLNRAFLRRAVRFLTTEAGIRQLVDIGSGLPTQGNVHQVAHQVDPDIHVAYVDNDPMVLTHGRALLADTDATTVVQADLRQPDEILNHPDLRRLIDLDQPVGLLLVAILHHINDDENPGEIAARLRATLPAGSYLVISHFHNPGDRLPEVANSAREAERIFNESFGTGRWRSPEEILSYFGDFTVLDPGLVPLPEWHPEPGEENPDVSAYTYHGVVGGVAHKP